jgi:hypothetical protein
MRAQVPPKPTHAPAARANIIAVVASSSLHARMQKEDGLYLDYNPVHILNHFVCNHLVHIDLNCHESSPQLVIASTDCFKIKMQKNHLSLGKIVVF